MGEEGNGLDIVTMALGFISGLVIFLMGVHLLSEGLKAVAGERMKKLLARFTTNRFAALGTGAVATAALNSSSVVTIMTVGLVHAGIMPFSRSLGVVMGANIGTTLTSEIFAFDLIKYLPVLLLPGFLLYLLGRSDWWRDLGQVVLGMGLVFFALTYLREVMAPLGKSEQAQEFLLRMENPFWGVLAGAAFTAIIQSSSAMMGILIGMIGEGTITLRAGIALMMGAELGTVAITLIATIGRSREAVRVGVFHLIYNLGSVALLIGFIGPLGRAVEMLAPDDPERQLAHSHVLFNMIGIAVFILFTRTLARVVCWIVPEKKETQSSREERASEPGLQAP